MAFNFFSFFTVGKCDVCDGYSQDSLQDALHVSATPRGGTEAGIYTKGNKSNMVILSTFQNSGSMQKECQHRRKLDHCFE